MDENYILSALILIALIAAFYLWKFLSGRKRVGSQSRFALSILELARSQFEIFNIKLQKSEVKNGLSAILHDISDYRLRMEVGDYASEEWKDASVYVYFKVQQDGDPVFYVFSSRVLELKPDYEASTLVLRAPEYLRVEKKRHFIRVQPDKGDVRALSVWTLPPGKRLPRTAGELGAPLSLYKPGMKEEPLRLVNISGAGIALEITGANDESQYKFEKGQRIICLIGYNFNNKYMAFWCDGEIMNVRESPGTPASTTLGLEFTNWAALEEGDGEIHWSHNSPLRGAKPILQWVDQIEQKKGK